LYRVVTGKRLGCALINKSITKADASFGLSFSAAFQKYWILRLHHKLGEVQLLLLNYTFITGENKSLENARGTGHVLPLGLKLQIITLISFINLFKARLSISSYLY
jgi:hypothetical protein